MIGAILGNVDVITLGIGVVIDLGSLDGYLDGYNYGNLEGLFVGGSLGYIDDKVIGSDEGIKLGYTDVKSIGVIPWNVYVTTLGIYFGTDLGSLCESFDGSNDVRIEGLLLGDSLGYNYGKVLGSNEDIKLGSTDDKFLGTIIGNVYRITLGVML